MTLELDPVPAPTRRHDRFDVAVQGLGRYTIDVSLPPESTSPDRRFPVVLAVDGNLLFDVVQVALHGGFARVGGVVPPSIVVGVGYPAGEGMAGFYGRRNRDFTRPWDMGDPLGLQIRAIFEHLKAAEGRPELEIGAGGHDRFLGFLRDELLPALATRYPVDPSGRHTLVGDSSGGYFALGALFDARSPFRRYVAISPSVGLAPGSLEAAEAGYASRHDDLDADVFVCCGQVEVALNPMMALCRFGSGVAWMAEQFALRRWRSARVAWEIMNNEDHASIQLRGVAAGLRAVHGLRPGVDDAAIAAVRPS